MSANPTDPIDLAICEDVGEGDVTTRFFVPGHGKALGRIVVHEDAVVAGTETAAEVFRRIDPSVNVEIICADGSKVNAGAVVMEIRGSTRSLLTAERVGLNFLQRLSGIATLTRKFVDAAGTDRVQILDTRKTTPGLRALEKAAVRAGGGANHRFGLFDMVLVKDNHIAACSGLAAFAESIRKLRRERPDLRIEVEADALEQVHAFLQMDGIDTILLDNMEPAEMREAVALGKKKVKFEASGGVNLKNIHQIAATGVDAISIGALTHSPPAIDFSLEITPLES
jgi:nicotinate-nucleotide pyrophosphorylase (carboxylating)